MVRKDEETAISVKGEAQFCPSNIQFFFCWKPYHLCPARTISNAYPRRLQLTILTAFRMPPKITPRKRHVHCTRADLEVLPVKPESIPFLLFSNRCLPVHQLLVVSFSRNVVTI